jgi:hypothetical protein
MGREKQEAQMEQQVIPYKSEAPEGSQKQAIFALLLDRARGNRVTVAGTRAKRKGFTNMTSRDIAKAMGMAEHDVMHALYDMRRLNKVEFRPSKSIANARRRGYAAAKGATPKNGSGIAVGIRIPQSVMRQYEAMDASEAAVMAVADAPTVVAPTVEHIGVEEVLLDVMPEEVGALVSRRDNKHMLDLGRFPNIARVASARANLDSAAALLRDAGYADHADLVAAETEKMSPLENEVADFVGSLRNLGLV